METLIRNQIRWDLGNMDLVTKPLKFRCNLKSSVENFEPTGWESKFEKNTFVHERER